MAYPVYLNVYDVTNTQSEDANALVVRINNITHQIGLGGVFHGGLVVDNHEWSFGYCDRGSGVYCCTPGKNPSYKFRLKIDLGTAPKTKEQLRSILVRLRSEWPGNSYELLTKNCNHFCEALAKELECKPTPAWLNRMASGADATITFTNEAAALARNIGTGVSSAAWWVRDSVSKMWSAPKEGGGSRDAPVGSDGTITPKHGMLFFALSPETSIPASYLSEKPAGDQQSITEERPTSAPVPEERFARLGRLDISRDSVAGPSALSSATVPSTSSTNSGVNMFSRPASSGLPPSESPVSTSGARGGVTAYKTSGGEILGRTSDGLRGEARPLPDDLIDRERTEAAASREELRILQSAAAAAVAARAAAAIRYGSRLGSTGGSHTSKDESKADFSSAVEPGVHPHVEPKHLLDV